MLYKVVLVFESAGGILTCDMEMEVLNTVLSSGTVSILGPVARSMVGANPG